MKNNNMNKCSLLVGTALTVSLALVPNMASAAEVGVTDANGGAVVTHEYKRTTNPVTVFNELRGLQDFDTKLTSDIVIYQGKLFVAYGQAYGPKSSVDLYSYNLSSGEVVFEVTVPSQDVDVINMVNGGLFVPNAFASSGASFTSKVDGVWGNTTVGANLMNNHDVVSSNGVDLFVSGSTVNSVTGQKEAAIWYSADGVSGWEKVKTGGEGASYYWLEAFEGKVYASASGSSDSVVNVWDAGIWSDVDYSQVGLSPEVVIYEADQVFTFKGNLVLNSYNPDYVGGAVGIVLIDLNSLSMVDTSGSITSDGNVIYQFVDVDVVGDVMYGLSEGGNIYATVDGLNWVLETVGPVFTSVSNFTVDPVTGIAYVTGFDDEDAPQIRSVNLISTFENNTAPVINLPGSLELNVGDSWMPFDNVTVTDAEEGDLTGRLKASGNVNLNVAGTYNQSYTVEDSNGYQTTATINVTVKGVVKPNTLPELSAPSAVLLNEGDEFNPQRLFAANDREDGNLTDKIVVTGVVDTSVPGDYEIVLTVTDSAGASVSQNVTVTVLKTEVVNNAPELKLSLGKVTVTQGDVFDPLVFVDVSEDAEDGVLVPVITGDVDTNTLGERTITYTVTDSKGVETVKTLSLEVIEKVVVPDVAPVIVANDVKVVKNSKFNPLSVVTASDAEDGDITSKVVVKSSNVNMKKNGTYTVVYSVTDSAGNITDKAIKVTVANKSGGLFGFISDIINWIIGIFK